MIESCQLKRPEGGTAGEEEARVAELLKRLGVTIVNPVFPAPHAMCCGAAGGMPVMQAEAARRMAEARLEKSRGDYVLALTLDGRCGAHLRDCAEDRVRVLGVGEFVEEYCVLVGGGKRRK